MTFVSYAQNYEDVLLRRALHDVDKGHYLDIGAQDPVVDSVSLAFYESGWRGIHVEPTPAYAAKLTAARPDETVIQAAVSDEHGALQFYEFPDTGLSTGKHDIAKRHCMAGYAKRKIVVPTIRLSELLEMQDGDFHWMKIDVEGMEPEVLRSWGDCKRRPLVLVIEATQPLLQVESHQTWASEVLSRGYREVHFDGLSRFFLHESQAHRAAAFDAPANVFDSFVITRRHFSAGALRSELEQVESQIAEGQDRLAGLEEDLAHGRRELHDALERLTATQEVAARTTEERDAARTDQLRASSALIDAERNHRTTIDAMWRERGAAERKLRHAAAEREAELRQALEQAVADSALVQAEVARLDERASQLQQRLSSTEREQDRLRGEFDRRAAEIRTQLDSAKHESVNERAELERRLAELQSALQHTEQASHSELAEQAKRLSDASEALRLAEAERDRALSEAETYRSAASAADTLIRNSVQSQSGRWRRFGEALGLVHPHPATLALADWSFPADPLPPPAVGRSTNIHTEGQMLSPAYLGERNPYLRADSLTELLAWDDVDFVRCAYVTVLGRQPDPEGEAYYTDRIRRGHSKMEVLWQLRRSEEGPNHDPGIAGLDRALRKAAWERSRAIGWAVRSFTGGEGDGHAVRSYRALSLQIAKIEAGQAQQLHALEKLSNRLNSQTPNLVVGESLPSVAEVLMTAPSHDEHTAQIRRLPARARRLFRALITH